MAETIETVSGEMKQSIARLTLFTEAELSPEDWRLVAHFEDGFYVDGRLVGPTNFGSRIVNRRFGDIKDMTIEAAGVKINIAQLAALIQAGIYKFRQEDIDNPVAI